jgi:hypothetical protein
MLAQHFLKNHRMAICWMLTLFTLLHWQAFTVNFAP